MDVVVDVDVVVVVNVDGDGNGNGNGDMDDPRSSEHLRKHRDDGFESLATAFVSGLCDDLAELHDVKRGSALHRLTTRNLVAVRAVSLRPASRAFGDVSDDGLGGA